MEGFIRPITAETMSGIEHLDDKTSVYLIRGAAGVPVIR